MKKIIDVSTHQGVIDWEKVKPNIDGAILRCGYGMDMESQDDEQWKRNADECTRLGIPFGAYIYSYADSPEKAKSEAAHVLRLIKGYKLSYPVYLDLEENGTQAGAVERANIFGDIIEKAGYWCGVYANLNWWKNYLPGLERFTKWVAQYNTKCDYKGANLDMWQYSSKGKVDGIKGNVDMNECYRDFPAEIRGKEKTAAKALKVDGVWGKDTTKASQKVMGTTEDGIVSNQPASCMKYVPAALTSSWEFKTSKYSAGSALVKAIQKLVGATVDGLCGKKTVTAMQTFLKGKKMYTGAIDGIMGPKTVKGWQQYINSRM